MSIQTTKNNYNIALSLYRRITKSFSEIEMGEGEEFDISQTIDDIKRLKSKIRSISITDFDGEFPEEKIKTIEKNVEKFKEMAFYIEKVLGGMEYYDDLLDSLPKYIGYTDVKDEEKEDAIKRVAAHLTHKDNFEVYKNDILNIIRGKMSDKMFRQIFDTVRVPREKIVRQNIREVPPEMWSEENQKEWKEREKQRWKNISQSKRKKNISGEKPIETTEKGKNFIKTPDGKKLEYDFITNVKGGIISYFKDDKKVYSFQNESFISLKEYKKIHEEIN